MAMCRAIEEHFKEIFKNRSKKCKYVCDKTLFVCTEVPFKLLTRTATLYCNFTYCQLKLTDGH